MTFVHGPVPGILKQPLATDPALSEIAPAYQAFIVDVWGVICDGERRYPGAVATLTRLRTIGPVALLSNTARRSGALIRFLRTLGIGDDCYDLVVTAGEVCHNALKRGDWCHEDRSRAKCLYYIGPDRDRAIISGTGVELCRSHSDAGGLLCTGMSEHAVSVEAHASGLLPGVWGGMPLICANPDKMVRIGAHLVPCAGALADHYERLGGQTIRFGKPHARIYRECFAALGTRCKGLTTDSILAIGDGLETDIKGATDFGLASVLVRTGLGGRPAVDGPGRIPQSTFVLDAFKW